MFLDQPADFVHAMRREAMLQRQLNLRFEPELRIAIRALHVHMHTFFFQ
jgi:hypothetical protein